MIFRKNKVKRSLPRKIGNAIIGFFIVLFVLLGIAFGFSQTSTFRNMLREKIISIADNSLNGKLHIGDVEGTLLTYIKLKDVLLLNNSDTLFSTKKLEVAINPFYILTKKIKITKFIIENANFSLLEIAPDEWNIDNLVKVDSSDILLNNDSAIVLETENKLFPFLIDVSGFSLKKITFKIKKNQYLNSHSQYEVINYNDIEIDNFNLDLNLLANINTNEFMVNISKLSFKPNLSKFTLHNLSGEIFLSENFAELKNLSVITDSSMLNLSARLEKFNLFGDIELKKLKNSPLSFELIATPVSASDLSAFIKSLKFMHGSPIITMKGKGIFRDFNFSSQLKLHNTLLNLDGNLTKLHTPSELYIKAKFDNSQINYNDVASFLSGLNLPKYPELFAKNINIKFEGKALVFNTKGSAEIDEGSFNFNAYMDITKDLIEYDYTINTNNLDLTSTLGINTKLNTKGRLVGHGFDPNKSSSSMHFNIANSFVEGHKIDSADIKLQTIDKLIDLEIYSYLDSMKNEIQGKLDLAIAEKPIYNLQGKFENLNLYNFTKDSTSNSSLNFTFDINGQSLDLDETEGQFQLNFIDSEIGSNKFDSINFQINLSKFDNIRLISFQSDLLDFNITGNFQLDETFNLLNYQSQKIGYAISQKLNEINPIQFSADTSNTLAYLQDNNHYSQKNIYFDFDFNFKDFKLIAALLNRDKVEISGKGYGYVENDPDNFTISTNMNIDWLFLYKDKDVFYISDVVNKFDIGADNKKYSFDNIFGSLSVNSEEMVSSLNINDIKADLVFNQSRAFINAEANIEDKFNTGIEGFFIFSDTTALFNISNLFFSYHDYDWANRDTIYIVNTLSKFDIHNFNLYNGNSKLNLNGLILNKRNLDFELSLLNLDGGTLTSKLLRSDISTTSSKINLIAKIKGTTSKPIYSIDFKMEDFYIKNNYIGSLFCNLDYENQNIRTSVEFVDTLNNKGEKLLTLKGNIPVNLDLVQTDGKVDSSKRLNLKFKTNRFNLAAFGNSIPTIENPQGIISADISLLGKLNDFNLSGYLTSRNFKFTSALNNLDYFANVNLIFDKKEIRIGNSYLKNIDKTNFPGKMNLTGKIITNGFDFNFADIFMNGSLALLSPASREVLPNFYGDLLIKTDPTWNFKFENEKPSFTGNILLDEVNLNYIPQESSYSVTNSDFKYIFINDTSASDLQKIKQSKLLSALSLKAKGEETSPLPTDFDLDIKIKSPKISKLSVVLSKALNQKLIADITGELRIKNLNNQFTSQGQFDILPSSMFTFYKTFNAKGNIKFTSDITNPLLNITATYISDYINPRDEEAEPIKTAVKIKINDSANSLLKNIASGEKPLDMKIYSGVQNIEYDVPNPQYTNLDAMYFILFGTFSTDTENANLAKSAGYSMLGSAFTSVLNARLGNIVNNVNINQTGRQTRFNISGRYQKVRYSVGGTVEEISDWSQASAKFEYLFSPQFIMRVERKDPVISSSYNTRKINEFGVMYRFSF